MDCLTDPAPIVGSTRTAHAKTSLTGLSVSRALRAAIGVSLMFAAGYAGAQAAPPQVPNSGQILQELERKPSVQPQLPGKALPEVSSRDADLTAGAEIKSDLRIDVRGYKLSGNHAFSDAELLPLVASKTGTASISQIEEAAANITRYYRDRGYMVARAFLPYQEVRGGIVKLEIIEGHFGQVRIENSSNISDRRLRATLERASCNTAECTEDLIREAPLEKGMLRLADLPGVLVRGSLQPGDKIGTADLVLQAVPAQRFAGSLDVSDYGGRYVGAERATLSLAFNSPFGIGDRINLQGAYSKGSTYLSAGYDLPINYRGTRLFFSGYKMDYELQDDFKALGAQGDTVGGEIGLMHNFVRTSRHSLTGRVTYGQKSIEDEIQIAGTSNERRAKTYTAQIDGAMNDGWLGTSALNRLSLGYTAGELDIQDPLSHLIDAATAGTDGGFDKIVYWLSRDQQITPRWSVFARVTGQIADQNLDSSEKFYLGGPSAVRAYPVGEAAGDRGVLASAEVRRVFDIPLIGLAQASMFYDYGRVRTDAQAWSSDGGRSRNLDGYGLSINWSNPKGFSLASSIAFRGDEDVRSGPDRDYQVWVSGGYRF